MANKLLYRGFVPVPDAYGLIRTKILAKGTGSSEALFVNSPYLVSSGVAVSTGTAATDDASGVIVALRDSNGKPRNNLGASEAGTVEVTFQKSQRYRAIVDDSAFALANGGAVCYSTTAESATAASASSDGDSYSKKLIDGSTEIAYNKDGADGMFLALSAVRKVDNAVAEAYTEIECMITPENFVQA